MAKRALSEALSPTDHKPSSSSCLSESNPSNSKSTYASSADNIARLLKGWMKKPPKPSSTSTTTTPALTMTSSANNFAALGADTASSEAALTPELSDTFESLFGFGSMDYCSSNSEFSPEATTTTTTFFDESKPDISNTTTGVDSDAVAQMPFYLLEKWLLDDVALQEKLEEDPHF